MLIKDFQRGIQTFFLLPRPPMPFYTANNQKFKFSECGYLWSDRLNIAVYQALLKVLPFLKLILQTNCLDFSYKLGFRQTQLAALWQWGLTAPHFSGIKVTFHPHRQPQVTWRLKVSSQMRLKLLIMCFLTPALTDKVTIEMIALYFQSNSIKFNAHWGCFQ